MFGGEIDPFEELDQSLVALPVAPVLTLPSSSVDEFPRATIKVNVAWKPILMALAAQLEWVQTWEAGTDIDITQAQAYVLTSIILHGVSELIGAMIFYATAVLPDNVLLCDGSTYNRVDYPQLYAVLHPDYIVDADTFTVPNFTGVTGLQPVIIAK